jgi:hypothetical protein
LTSITKTDTQSFMAIMHNTQYLTTHYRYRPANPSDAIRLAHWGLGAVLTLIVCLAAGWRRNEKPLAEMFFLGLLVMLMMFLSPVCHLHYFAWLIPVVMASLLLEWENRRDLDLSLGWMTLLILNNVVHIGAHMTENPDIRVVFRDFGLATWVGLAIGVIGVIHLWRLTRRASWRKPDVATQSHYFFAGAAAASSSAKS